MTQSHAMELRVGAARGMIAAGLMVAGFSVILSVCMSGSGRAETSGWTSKVEGAEPSGSAPTKIVPPQPVAPSPAFKEPPKGSVKAVSPEPAKPAKPSSQPAHKSAAPASAGSPAAKSAAPVTAIVRPPTKTGSVPELPISLPPPSGETAEAAYELFDQGRYLSALSTAVKAVHATHPPEAYTLIGRIYEEGLGVGRNPDVAVEWYAQGAELGDLNAQFALGLMYAEGRGTAKNLSRAAGAFEAAAKQGHVVAQYNLGMIYAHGDGRDEDFAQAAYWLEKAAEKSHAPAQYDLATLYYEGRGVPVDEAKAVTLLGKAANAGMPSAQLDYARMVAKGEGLPALTGTDAEQKAEKARRDKIAFDYIKLAAEKGNPVAQNRLARFYFFGVVVDSDLVEGAKWHLLGRAAGVSDMALDNLLTKMPADQRAKADQAASVWSTRSVME